MHIVSGGDQVIGKENELIKINPGQIDWNGLWNENLKKMPKLNHEAWDKIAPQFDRWMKTDDYPGKLVERIRVSPEYTVLDMGCGNGAVTIPIAKKAKHVTALDMSDKMLSFLRKNAEKEGLSNITCIESTLQDMELEDAEEYDVVIASRSLGGVSDIKNELKKIDSMAKKYVYLTLWGANAREFEKKVYEIIGRNFQQHSDYIYVVNILYQMGIYANVETLECEKKPSYANLEEVVDFLRWRIINMTEREEALLRSYIARVMVKDENGMLQYPYGKSDWVLIWWKKKDPNF